MLTFAATLLDDDGIICNVDRDCNDDVTLIDAGDSTVDTSRTSDDEFVTIDCNNVE